MKDFITKKRVYSVAGIIFILVIWKIISIISDSEQIMPSPERVIKDSANVLINKDFLSMMGSTLGRGITGFFISLFLAFIIGIPAGLFPHFFHFINPVIVTIRSTPVISLILLAIIWLGSNMVPVLIAVLTMFPVICLNIIEGIKNVDHDLVSMGKNYQVRKTRIFTTIYIPSILPYLISSISNAMGFGWRAIIIGEVLSQPKFGIGTKMQEARSFLLVSELITWTAIAIVISYLFEMIIRKTEKQLIKWKN